VIGAERSNVLRRAVRGVRASTTLQLDVMGAELIGPADIAVVSVSGIDAAGKGDLTFIRSPRYANRWRSSRASAAIVSRGVDVPGHDPETRALLVVEDADRALVTLLEATAVKSPKRAIEPGVHPSAVVDPSAEVAGSAHIGPCAVVGAGAKIGAGAVIGPNCTVEDGVVVGEKTVLHAGVSLRVGTRVGRGCEFFAGAAIGSDGFGFLPGPEGPIKVPHLGGVTIGDGVEVGANTCIDRGKFADTVIGDMTKIDNLVQMGHACRLGRGVVICGCCAIGGSVTIGDGAMLGGAVSVRDNITIAAGAMIGGNSGVDSDVTAEEPFFGNPARPASLSQRVYIGALRLPAMREKLMDLARRVRALEGRGS